MAMTDAERADRYRARKAGRDVPKLPPGPRPGHGGRPAAPVDHAQEAVNGLGAALHHLGWVHHLDSGTHDQLAELLAMVSVQVARLRPGPN
jgi:hypothetical protein